MRSVAVIGMGRFGVALARELESLGIEVLALDFNEEDLQRVQGQVSACRVVDARDRKELAAAGVADVDVVIVAIGENFEAAQECILALRKLGVRRIIGRAQTTDRTRILEKIGAGRVVSPEIESAKRVAQSLAHPLLEDAIDIGDGVRISTLEAPEDLVGKSLMEIGTARLEGLLVLRVVRGAENAPDRVVIMPAGAGTRLEVGDRLTLVGRPEDLARFLG
ncbi:MAG: TrkA family potassium uptake protein, partial [Planctomycetes bacterium]|nr:TrkA family potassium uptake protein [Planctomycetota bacterium]